MKPLLLKYLLIGTAGFLGAIARVVLGEWFVRFQRGFPLGTLVINVTGSFFLGWFYQFCTARNVSPMARMAIGAGFVGAYTTFSTYMYDTNNLAEKGAMNLALVNLVGSLVLGLMAVKAGVVLARYQVTP